MLTEAKALQAASVASLVTGIFDFTGDFSSTEQVAEEDSCQAEQGATVQHQRAPHYSLLLCRQRQS